jgi:hypothetical protein
MNERLKLFLALAGALAVVGLGSVSARPAWRAWQAFQAGDDPSAVADLHMKEVMTPARAAAEIDAALAAKDGELVASFIELAKANGVAVDPAKLDQLAVLRARPCSSGVQSGFASGGFEDSCELAGVVARDLSGYGDLSDLYQEGSKLLSGGAPDKLLLSLAAVGLVSTAATVLTLGGAAEARGGLTTFKALHKAGRLSKPLAANLARMASEAIDRDAIKTVQTAAWRMETEGALAAAKKIVRPTVFSKLKNLGTDVEIIADRTGSRGALQVFAVAESADDVRQAARLAKARGSTTRAILKLFGRSVLIASTLSAIAIGWIFTFVGYVFILAIFARQFGLWIGRRLWSRASMSGAKPAV